MTVRVRMIFQKDPFRKYDKNSLLTWTAALSFLVKTVATTVETHFRRSVVSKSRNNEKLKLI